MVRGNTPLARGTDLIAYLYRRRLPGLDIAILVEATPLQCIYNLVSHVNRGDKEEFLR